VKERNFRLIIEFEGWKFPSHSSSCDASALLRYAYSCNNRRKNHETIEVHWTHKKQRSKTLNSILRYLLNKAFFKGQLQTQIKPKQQPGRIYYKGQGDQLHPINSNNPLKTQRSIHKYTTIPIIPLSQTHQIIAPSVSNSTPVKLILFSASLNTWTPSIFSTSTCLTSSIVWCTMGLEIS